jgi:hypothetical protein
MPEGPAERGVEASRARSRAGARHAESIDSAEPSGSIELVMAGRQAAARSGFSKSVACGRVRSTSRTARIYSRAAS